MNIISFHKLVVFCIITAMVSDCGLAPETKLPGIIEDLEDAIAWVCREGPALLNIDPERIAVIGHSAGGYLTLMAGFRARPVPKAPDSVYNQRPRVDKDIAFQAVGDSVVSNAPARTPGYSREQFYLYCRQNGLWPLQVSGHDTHRELEWFLPYEPLRNVHGGYSPTVLLHGEKDTDVPFWQSVKMAGEFRKHRLPFELITEPYWTHGFDRAGLNDESVRQAFDKILSFLKSHL
jgi:acetyl esterase/lipase